MCLGIPGKIIEISDATRRLAMVEVCGIKREVNVACIAEKDLACDELIGTWVLVHVGFAMSRINEEEAQKTMDILKSLGEAQEEIEAMRLSAAMLEREEVRS